MNRFVAWLFLPLIWGFQTAGAGEYRGAVGKMAAVFSIDFHDDGSVSGTYSYPARKGVVYRLSGSNPRQGELYLEEYTGRNLSAKCYLSKRVSGDAIIWEGTMKNTDGRQLAMSFSRGRGVAAAPVAQAGESVYTGNVGKLAAEYFLRWGDDGRVSGTYHYPSRPGKSYRLEGTNPRAGVLFLTEYTGSVVSAKCSLEKRVTGGSIVWEGKMSNTDGRELAMSMTRGRDAVGGDPAPAAKLVPPTWYSSVEREENWNAFPKANEFVEMVPITFPDEEWVTAKVKSYTTRSGEMEMVYALGVRNQNDFEDVRYEGPEVTFRAARGVPIPQSEIVGKEIYLQYERKTGRLLALTLHGIALTHVRKSDGEKFEIRGLLDSGEFEQFHDSTIGVKQEMIENADFVAFVPDKVALSDYQELDYPFELFFQELRIVRDYGISIQATAAGPGMLELEGLSLDEPVEVKPWIFLGGDESWGEIPRSQITWEAG